MSQTKSTRFSESEKSALEQFAEDEDISESQALQKTSAIGLRQMGYNVEDPTGDEFLPKLYRELSKGMAYAGVAMLVFHGLTEFDRALLYGSYTLSVAVALMAIGTLRPQLSWLSGAEWPFLAGGEES